MQQAGAADRVAGLAVTALFAGIVFYLNFRFVLVHFSSGGDLLDTGWFAWIMASGDPWLTSPRSVSGLSYFNYHLSPWLSGLSLAFHALGVDRFTALALHQGAMFALLAGSLFALVLGAWAGRRSVLLYLAVALVVLFGDVLLQIASFPHFEIAIPACCALGLALWQAGRHRLAVLAFALACLVREDGGLYAGAFLIGLAALRPLGRQMLASREAGLAVAAILVSLVMFWIKSRYFPGYPTFTGNFSGKDWDHVTPQFIFERLAALAANPHALAVFVPALLLGLCSPRYFVFLLLFLPIIAAQLLAVRLQLGHFMAYYATPFVMIWIGLVLVATDRARRQKLRWPEPAILLAAAILGSGPVLFALKPPAWFPVIAFALTGPVVDLPDLARQTSAAIGGVPGACVSLGVAALIPDDFTPAQVLDPDSDLAACRTVFLFNTDIHYKALRPRLAAYAPGPVIAGRIERYDQRP